MSSYPAEILCLGLAPALDVTVVVDSVTSGRTHRPSFVARLAGGKSLNVVRALDTLGTAATAIVPLGGPLGNAVAELIHASGHTANIIASAVPTRMCVSIVSESLSTVTEFYEHAQRLSRTEWTEIESTLGHSSPKWMIISGSVAPDESIERLVRAARDAADSGATIVIDTHGPALAALLAGGSVHLVKVNQSEASELVGEGDPLRQAVALLDFGVNIAVVTDGPRGSAAASADGRRLRVRCEPAGIYTPGCGDSFLAGVVSGLLRGDSLEDALRLGSGCAAANTYLPGAAVFDLAVAHAHAVSTHVIAAE